MKAFFVIIAVVAAIIGVLGLVAQAMSDAPGDDYGHHVAAWCAAILIVCLLIISRL